MILDSPSAALQSNKVPSSLFSAQDFQNSLVPLNFARPPTPGTAGGVIVRSDNNAMPLNRARNRFCCDIAALGFRPTTSGLPPTLSNLSPAASSPAGTDTDIACARIHFSDITQIRPPKPKHYYRFWVLPMKYIKIRFDRLQLLALLDR